MRPNPPHFTRRPQRGIALAVVLVVMTILVLLGMLLLVQSDTNLLMAGNEREAAICRQAAEAATRQGIALASLRYSTATYYSSVLNCTDANASVSLCPISVAQLASSWIVDKPGNPFALVGTVASPTVTDTNNWYDRRFSGTGAGDRTSVYISIYARNNDGESNPSTDADRRVTIVGEAVMTNDGAVPLLNRTNVRVRKIIAADILVPGSAGGAGGSKSGSNGGTTY